MRKRERRLPATATGEAEETCCWIRNLHREAESFSADLGIVHGAAQLYEAVTASMGAPDILVNNAGTIYREAAEDHNLESWMQVLQVNLTSVFELSQLAGRAMLARGAGKIINIVSLLSFQGGVRVPSYAASKGGFGPVDQGSCQRVAGDAMCR